MHALVLALFFWVPIAVDAGTDAIVPGVSVSLSPGSADGLVRVTTQDGDGTYASFHGEFAIGELPQSIALGRVSRDERAALDQVNRFRARFGMQPLTIDQNLTQTARYWAGEEKRSGRVGHTCASLGDPAGCIEFNTYFHALPGAPQRDFSGQNAAFDSIASWSDPDALFEAEERCSACERGHFLNLIGATAWIGFGKAAGADGSYFAMNLI